MAGKKALGAWLQRCTAELGDILVLGHLGN